MKGLLRCLAPAALAAILSCGPFTETGNPVVEGPSTETGNPALTGIVRDTGGLRAGGAPVVLWRLPAGAGDTAALRDPVRADSQAARADGSFRFDSLAAGRYAILAGDAARGLALSPPAEVPAGAKGFLRRDTLDLRRPARLAGIARRDANPKPRGVTAHENILVRVAGTGRSAYTDTAGNYAIDNVPAGTFPVAFAASDGHYLPKVLDPVDFSAGAAVTLPPVTLEWSPFVAPPAPGGLTVTPDSASPIIRLRWNKVHVSNFDHYLVIRRDSGMAGGAVADTFDTGDTVFIDAGIDRPAGTIFTYTVVAVNQLGNASPEPSVRQATLPRPPEPPATGMVAARLIDAGNAPVKGLVRLYALPTEPGPEDSLPRRPALVDSAPAGADGIARFPGKPIGPYSLVAVADGGALMGAKAGAVPRREELPEVILMGAPGSYAGAVTRKQIWCSHPAKQNEAVDVSVSGLPFFRTTDFDGRFSLPAIPPGAWRVVFQALPTGCFLPDTVDAAVKPGQAVRLDTVVTRTDPAYIPKVASLRLTGSSRGQAMLAWNPAPAAWTGFKAYEVARRDSAQKILATSGEVAVPAWTDDLSGASAGTRLNYVVRMVSESGAKGPWGGDSTGKPVYFTVPAD